MLIAALLAAASLNLSIFNPLKIAFEDFAFTDVYYAMLKSGEKELCTDIVLVDMTRQRDRGEIARTLQAVSECRPKVVCVDLIFEKESAYAAADAELVGTVETVPNLVLSSKILDYDAERDAFRTRVLSFFSAFGSYEWGYGNLPAKHGRGYIRDYTLSELYDSTRVYSLAYVAACRYLGKRPTEEPNNSRPIVYANTDFPVISCDSVREHAGLLQGKLVLVGTMTEESDMHITPVGKMPGMKVQAFAAYSYLTHQEIRNMSDTSGLIIAFIICYFSAFFGLWLTQRYPYTGIYLRKLYYFLLAAVLVWAGFVLFVRYNYNINLLYPLLGLALVEEARFHYKWIVAFINRHPRWRFAKNSIYNADK
ncbi:MAG: CHASE2 domain-containing protein [Alloprevotella sp.]|nr:CHASE2 domain-containing protein [Alloprevotella sp.]